MGSYLLNCGVTQTTLKEDSPVRLVFLNTVMRDNRENELRSSDYNFENLIVSGTMMDCGRIDVVESDYEKIKFLMLTLFPLLHGENEWKEKFKEMKEQETISSEEWLESFHDLLYEIRNHNIFYLASTQGCIASLKVSFVDEAVFEEGMKSPISLYSPISEKSDSWIASFDEYLDFIYLENLNLSERSLQRLKESNFFSGKDQERREKIFTLSHLLVSNSSTRLIYDLLGYYPLIYKYLDYEPEESFDEVFKRYLLEFKDALLLKYLSLLGVRFSPSTYAGQDYSDEFGRNYRTLMMKVFEKQKLSNIRQEWEWGEVEDRSSKKKFIQEKMKVPEVEFDASTPAIPNTAEIQERLSNFKK